MNLLCTNDWHFANKNPGSRIDDYNGELFAFLDQLLLLGRHFQCGAILVAGDLFHNKAQVGWYVLHRLLSWGLQVRESGIELLTISGNHDQKDDRYESLQQTPYGVLVASGVFTDISRRAHRVKGNGPTVYGVPWPDGALPDAFKGLPEGVDVVVAHAFATT